MNTTWIVTNDWQVPFQDEQVIDGLFFPFIRWLKPDGLIWNGDITDCYDLSEFSKNPLLGATLDKEVEIAQGYMDRIRTIKSIQKKIWLGGNHEDRIRRYMNQHGPKLMLKEAETFETKFKPAAYGFEYRPYGAVYNLGKLDVTHGSVVRQHSGWSGKAHFEKRGGSVLIGHTHRLGIYYRTNAKGTHAAFENGCLCSLHPEYVQDPDWQQGWSVVHVGAGGFYHVQQIPVIDRRMVFYGNKEFRT